MSRQVFVLISMFLNKEMFFLKAITKANCVVLILSKKRTKYLPALTYIHIEGSAESGKYFVPILDDMRTTQFGFEIS